MIHPSNLLRSDSRSKQFSAPLNLQGPSENDWGISVFPCLSKVFSWRTFGRPSVFTVLLSLIGCTQGLQLYYFRNTAEIWAKQYYIPKSSWEWIIYVNEFFVGFLALPISYWASVTHRVVWLSLLVICHGIISILLFVPERFYAKPISITNTTVHLCGTYHRSTNEDTNYIMVAVIFLYQLICAASSVAFFCIGLVYVDDNVPKNKSAILAIALASKQLGQQLGIYLSWIPRFFKVQYIFRSFVWQGVSVLHIVLGILIAMFPKVLPRLLIKKLAASLLELASGTSMSSILTPNSQGFFISIRNILTNKVVLLTITSLVCVQSGLINFGIFENYFKQSRFFLSDNFDKSGYDNSFSLNFTTNLLEQPFNIMCMLVTGFVISRSKIKLKYLVVWNILTLAICTLLFSSYLFIRCDYEKMTQLVPSCSVDCGCTLEETFKPVCLHGRTYFSPCHAGCSGEEEIDEYKFFKNCSCASFEGTASDGSCHAEKCKILYQLTQVNNVLIEGLLSTTMITSIYIILSKVRIKEKSLALGLAITMLSLVPFLPVKILYHFLAKNFCRQWYRGKCRIYSEQFSDFLSNATVGLMIAGTITQIFILFLNLEHSFKRKAADNSEISSNKDVTIHYSTYESSDAESSGLSAKKTTAESEESKHNSLDDFDSLGDDHDSDEEIALKQYNLKDSKDNLHNFVTLESHL